MKHPYENSRLIHASFGSREMFSQWFTSAFGLYTILFYESIIGLPSLLMIPAFLISPCGMQSTTPSPAT